MVGWLRKSERKRKSEGERKSEIYIYIVGWFKIKQVNHILNHKHKLTIVSFCIILLQHSLTHIYCDNSIVFNYENIVNREIKNGKEGKSRPKRIFSTFNPEFT